MIWNLVGAWALAIEAVISLEWWRKRRARRNRIDFLTGRR